MRLVYICSPLRGDIELNMKRARAYCAYAVKQGVNPIAPHLLYTQFLDDNSESDRELAIKLDLELLSKCDELWVFNIYGISQGMQAEIAYAVQHDIPLRYISHIPYTLMQP